MTDPRIEIAIDVHQLRDALGRFAKYSEELERTRIRPIAEGLAEIMQVIMLEEIPSERVARGFRREIHVGPKGTEIRFVPVAKEWEDLALLLLYGAPPHMIFPRRRRALFWMGGGTTRGAPNRPPKRIKHPPGSPPHPVAWVDHPGFRGYNYLDAIERRVVDEGLWGPWGYATQIGREAELRLTPEPGAVYRESVALQKQWRSLRDIYSELPMPLRGVARDMTRKMGFLGR